MARPFIYKPLDPTMYRSYDHPRDFMEFIVHISIHSSILDSHKPSTRFLYKGYLPGDFIEALPASWKERLKDLKSEHIKSVRFP